MDHRTTVDYVLMDTKAASLLDTCVTHFEEDHLLFWLVKWELVWCRMELGQWVEGTGNADYMGEVADRLAPF